MTGNLQTGSISFGLGIEILDFFSICATNIYCWGHSVGSRVGTSIPGVVLLLYDATYVSLLAF